MDSWGYRIVAGVLVAAALLAILHSVDILPHRQPDVLNRTQLNGWLSEAAAYLGPYATHAKYTSGVLAAAVIGLCFSLFVQRVNMERQLQAEEEGAQEGGVSYCVNRMTDDEFRDKAFTRKSVMELLNSPEYQKSIREKRANVCEERSPHSNLSPENTEYQKIVREDRSTVARKSAEST
eukprot:GHVS01054768.1.p1 GENE.GHVS01054768.1~~GHVS01054768.1.p1  ORF type:complete len:179 (+),score=39.89 GHVS01054768.1:821-1357(+)